MSNDDIIYTMALKLKSVTQLKLLTGRDLLMIRDSELAMTEELGIVKAENDFLKELLQDLNNQIAQATHQISLIEICSTSENVKIDAHIRNMENHRKGFQDIFNKVQKKHLKEIQEKEEAEAEILRQKKREIAELNERNAIEAAAVEAECDAFDKECAVLKKRNNAIMLKLRRKLLETENTRRELLKRSAPETIE